jgi:hypothetical protein
MFTARYALSPCIKQIRFVFNFNFNVKFKVTITEMYSRIPREPLKDPTFGNQWVRVVHSDTLQLLFNIRRDIVIAPATAETWNATFPVYSGFWAIKNGICRTRGV